MKILLANPRGFCAGVDRAIAIVERALELLGAPIYVRHEVVHNQYVVTQLRQAGAIFTDEMADIPEGATVIFSAHGVSQQVRQIAQDKSLKVFDATCPLVTKVHLEVARHSRQGIECILIGHAGHPEVEGTLGQYDNPNGAIYLVETEADVEQLRLKNPAQVALVTQTTLSVDDTIKLTQAIRARYPQIKEPKREDICYATQNRQDAVKILAQNADVVIVLGSANSSNSNRLQELSERLGCPAHLIDGAHELKQEWFINTPIIGITAGASAPEKLVREVITQLEKWGVSQVEDIQGPAENIVFALPKELRLSPSDSL